MGEQKIGQCLHVYLKNMLLLSAIEDDEDLPTDVNEDQKLIASFRERSTEQAVGLLEDVYSSLLTGVGTVPYKADRSTQRKTVRKNLCMEGRIYRPHEKRARVYWALHLGCLRDKGPSLSYIIGPQESSGLAMDDLAIQVAPFLGIESANPRQCFTRTRHEIGVLGATVPLSPGINQGDVIRGMKEKLGAFFTKFRTQLETAVES